MGCEHSNRCDEFFVYYGVALDDYKRIQTPPKLPTWALPNGNGHNGNGSDGRTTRADKLKPQEQPKTAVNVGPHKRSDKEVALMEDLGFNVPDEERKNPKTASAGTLLPEFVPQKVRDKFATIEELPTATLEYFVTKWQHQGDEQEAFVATCKQLLMEPA